MKPDAGPAPGAERERLEREIAALEAYADELADAIDDFEHESRRCRDRLERAGGDPYRLARELERLAGNRDFNRRELEDCGRRLNRLKTELATLREGAGP